jgi:hypothetical protein
MAISRRRIAEMLVWKLVLTPALIAVATLAGRRFGPSVGGWLVGLPFTSGPIAFFLALDPGPTFAARASEAIMAGAISQAVFCVAFAWMARRAGWAPCLVAATLGYAVATFVLALLVLGTAASFVIVMIVLVVALFVMPEAARTTRSPVVYPRWDVPARMVVATAFVVALTESAPLLGPRVAGLVAPFPLYGAVLASFARRVEGADAAVQVMRGLILGLFAFACFFAVLSSLLERDIALAFAAAAAATVAVQGAALLAGRRLGLA